MITSKHITTFAAVFIPLGMLGLAFASKPLYDTFCRVTGFGGTVTVADKAPEYVSDRQINIRFDANIQKGLPLAFKPLQASMPIKLGETALAFYEITNTSDTPITAIATFNVVPFKAAPYYRKLECFCFEDQVYMPGETVRLPVAFFVEPELDEKSILKDVSTITLSYTYYESGKDISGQAAAIEPVASVHTES